MSDGHVVMLMAAGLVFIWAAIAFSAAFVGCVLGVLLSPESD